MSKQSQIKPFELRTTVDYDRTIYGEIENPYDSSNSAIRARRRAIDKRAMKCEVQITIDLEWIVRNMGPRACINANRRCRKGPIIVKQIGIPTETSRKMRTTHAD